MKQLLLVAPVLATAQSFDYIIAGAGTAGLVIANRLSEDPTVTVAVIEPGTDQRNNPNVTEWENFTFAFGTAIDWDYSSVPQEYLDNQTLTTHQGKAWGGTSTINGMTYIRADAAEIDAWEDLGNPGWNWDSLFPYYKKAENYTIPNAQQQIAGATYESQNHGFDGHVHVGYPLALVNTSFAPAVFQTWEGLSIPENPDLNSGHVHGFSIGPQTIDTALDIRWDAARAYLYSVLDRPNLTILQGTVQRVTWAAQKCQGNSQLVANGVEFITADGETQSLKAEREVILSAGTLRTPLILEGSGVGNPSVLDKLGVQAVIELPGVGENVIEQPSLFLVFSGQGGDSASAHHAFVTAADLFGGDLAAIEASTRASLGKWAQAAVDAGSALNASAVQTLLSIQHDLIFKKNVTMAELLVVSVPAASILATNYWILLPFSRGSVHLGAVDEINSPVYNPSLFLADFDLNATIAVGKLAQKFWLSEPMVNYVEGPLLPGPELLPDNATDAQWVAYSKSSVSTNSHALASAAMMSRELGGVVDSELRVYGTANVRVVDASVLPTQVSGHLTATIYAVAERAAEIIQGVSW